MEPEDARASKERLGSAIQAEAAWLAEEPGAYLAGWHMVAEWVDPEGRRWLSETAHEDSTTWQRMGYLNAALETERAGWESPG